MVEVISEKYSYQFLKGLIKVGKGRYSYRVIATYVPWNITIGIRTNRDPAKNGIRLVFHENRQQQPGNNDDDDIPSSSSSERTKLGYLLMVNTETTSTLLGMYLNLEERGRGMAKVCVATWLWFCLKANLIPITGVINKPLISMLLQYRFGFIPDKGGILLEVAPNPEDPLGTLVYASYEKSLEGVFCPRDLQNQNISILLSPPTPRGRLVFVKTTMKPPDLIQLKELVDGILCNGDLDCSLTPSEIRIVYLGKQ